jgi:subtilisin
MAEDYLRERPEHIVTFREVNDKNTDILSKVLGVGEASNLSKRSSCAVLNPSEYNRTHTRVYQNLAVAATTLNKDQINELIKKDDIILEISKNELRWIPPSIRGTDLTDSLSSYLQGMSHAIEAIQRFHLGIESIPFSSITPQAMSFSRSWSYCLELIGISPDYTVSTGKGVKVAVLDTGIDINHPDFQNRLIENDNTRCWISGETVLDGHGHGTHCAGIIAGPHSSISGKRYGVAPDVDLLIAKVLNNYGYGYDDHILDAMDWASLNGAKIISMSLVSEKDNNRLINQPSSIAYEQVASILLEQGTLVVAAAGNSSVRPQFIRPVDNPAACPSIIAVAAVDHHRRIAKFSCAKMDDLGEINISAPGVAVYSAYKNQSFWNDSGTSMATPHVAGVAALYFQLHPNLSAKEIWNMLIANALPLGSLEDYGNGLVQAPINGNSTS